MGLAYWMNCSRPIWRETSTIIHLHSVDRHYQNHSSMTKNSLLYSNVPEPMHGTHCTDRYLWNTKALKWISIDDWSSTLMMVLPERHIDRRTEICRWTISPIRTGATTNFSVWDHLIITSLQARIIDQCRSIRTLHQYSLVDQTCLFLPIAEIRVRVHVVVGVEKIHCVPFSRRLRSNETDLCAGT